MSKVTQYETIRTTLLKAPKMGYTAYVIADKTGIGLRSVRSTLQQLKVDGLLVVIGAVHTGSRGRPQNVYRHATYADLDA